VTDIDDSPTAATDAGPAALRTSVRRGGGRLWSPGFVDTALIQELQTHYDLGRWRSWRRTESGKSNQSFFVETDGGPVVLRRSSRIKTGPAARFEAALIQHLVSCGYPAPSVVQSSDGEVLVEVDGQIHMVTRLLPGAAFDEGEGAHLVAAARGLARYHAHVRELPTDLSPRESSSVVGLSRRCEARLTQVRTVVEPLLTVQADAFRRDLDYLTHELHSLDATFDAIQSQLTYLIVHGSYSRTALLFTGHELTGVVDYDRAVHDFLVLDLAYALKSIARLRLKSSDGAWIDIERAAAFVRSYRTELPLAEADTAGLLIALRTQRLATVDKKCDNILAKHALIPRGPDDAAGFAGLVAREVGRLRWIADNEPQLTRALGA
jgi:Ser/Thr protein kinase RdoA (MazF antagonist)